MDCLRDEDVQGLRSIFDAFDHNSDGLLDPEEVSAILVRFGLVLTESEVLDMVTEVKPQLRKLPFDEFVALVCHEMPGDDIQEEVAETFSTFADDEQTITSASLKQAMDGLGLPVSPLMSRDMIREADLDKDGKVNLQDFRRSLLT